MFVVTKRLLLRPGWPEDAPALFRAFADERVVMSLARAPWPYRLEDAEAFLARRGDPRHPNFLIVERGGSAAPIIGGVGFHDNEDAPELGYWLTPDRWGRGYMHEAASAALDSARACLGYRRFVSGHFADNPASGRVLEKLGFRPTGEVERHYAVAQSREVDCVIFARDDEAMQDNRGDTQMSLAA